ncbi:hypothetical protein C8R43DRAFT_193569 [Mycena crocata]|nr:hypothetical protein C8R43DRAFT_193569 [Mycena crocata]
MSCFVTAVAPTPLDIAAAVNVVLTADPTSRLSLSAPYTPGSSLSPLIRRRRPQPRLHLLPPSERPVSIPPTIFKCSTPPPFSKSLQRRRWSHQHLTYPMLNSSVQNHTDGSISHRWLQNWNPDSILALKFGCGASILTKSYHPRSRTRFRVLKTVMFSRSVDPLHSHPFRCLSPQIHFRTVLQNVEWLDY